jgi:CRISPR-associated endoribonuclease Cas6
MSLLTKTALKISQKLELPNLEIVGLNLELKPQTNSYIYPDYSKGLHAWFLQQIGQFDPNLSQILHDEQEQKAFTLSLLEGKITPYGDKLQIYQEESYNWLITILSASVINWLKDWLKSMPNLIKLRNITLEIKSLKIELPPTSYLKLREIKPNSKLTLSFLSPTTFRRKGYHFPLPLPQNIFHSYLRRWLNFSGENIDTETFLNWIEDEVIISRHQLESLKIVGAKGGSITAFIGAVEYNLTHQGKQNKDFLQLYSILGQFAPYCGTGHKTTFGLGKTRLGWLITENSQQITSELSLENQLAERIEVLTNLLLSQQKRTGGERAFKVCQTRATILARREIGESLTAIASDLEMPYDTVKSYLKLARRVIKNQTLIEES